jgi:hypothetical protein
VISGKNQGTGSTAAIGHRFTFASLYRDSVVPTRHFLGKPVINEEMNIEIEAGKLLIIKLLAIGKINENTGTRECFFEVNAETRVVVIEDRQAAVSKVTRDKATSEPGSIGSPMVSGTRPRDRLVRVLMLIEPLFVGRCCCRGSSQGRIRGQGG